MTRKPSHQEPMKMHTPREMNSLIRSLSAVTILAASVGLGAVAAQAQAPTTSAPISSAMDFRAYMAAPVNPAAASASDSSSFSSSSSSADAAEPSAPSLSESANQPPPRRRYGRPSYADSHTNADGSAKWTFVAGVGPTIPVSTTSNVLTTGYSFQVGGGRNFNKKFGVLLQFDYNHFGFQNSTLNNLLTIYNDPTIDAQLTSLGGSSHVWSFTLNPIYNLTQGDNWGTYVVAGVGFYHKVADFTTPTEGEYYDPYYGLIPYEANQVIDSYVSNAPGFNGGGGVTYKFSRFTSEKLFAEVRYVYTVNSARPYYDGTTGTAVTPTYFNVFPQNSLHTTYLPVTIGIRF